MTAHLVRGPDDERRRELRGLLVDDPEVLLGVKLGVIVVHVGHPDRHARRRHLK